MSKDALMTRAYSDTLLIVDVCFADNGLGCNCTCICCGADVVANQGKIKAKYFSHRPGDSRADSCTWSYETDLHIIAKEVLTKTKHLFVSRDNNPKHDMDMNFDSVCKEAELSLDDSKRRPDLTAVFSDDRPLESKYSGETIFIEIFVKNKCSQEKIAEFKSLNLNVIEIDLQGFELTENTVTFEDVENYITNKAPKKWISLQPAGEISKQVNAYERTILIDLITERKNVQKALEDLQNQKADAEFFFQQYGADLSHKTSIIGSLDSKIYNLKNEITELENKYRDSQFYLKKSYKDLQEQYEDLQDDHRILLLDYTNLSQQTTRLQNQLPTINAEVIDQQANALIEQRYAQIVRDIEDEYYTNLGLVECDLKVRIEELKENQDKLQEEIAQLMKT